MTKSYDLLVGTSVDYQRSLFYEMLSSGNLYLGFGRNSPIWGFGTLIQLEHNSTYPTDAIATAQSQGTKFYDIETDGIISGGNIAGSDTVFVGYKLKSATSWTFVLEGEAGIGNLSLLHMNENWAMIKGLNSEYIENLLSKYSISSYDYALFNYNKELTTLCAISLMDNVTPLEIKEEVKLMYSTGENATSPTTAFNSSLIGTLYKHINNLGETYISGLESSFVIDGLGYIEQNSLNSASYFITDVNGVILQDNIKYINITHSTEEIAIEFSYPIVGEVIQNSGRLKFVSQGPSDRLAIFYEQFQDGVDVSDITPPPMSLDYLKSGAFQKSIFDIQGMIKINSLQVNGNDGGTTIATSSFTTDVNMTTLSVDELAGSKLVLCGLDAGLYAIVTNTNLASGNTIVVSEIFPKTLTNSDFFIRKDDELKFARRIDNQTTKDVLLGVPNPGGQDTRAVDPNYPGVPSVSLANVITTIIDDDTETAVDYAVTANISDAITYSFDFVQIDKSVAGGVGGEVTENIYRELFVCFNPKDANGANMTASEATHADLFQETNHTYDLGTILYLARKEPVFRKHLQSPEDFKIIF